jgi:RNA polymerase sigma-70 factor (ECF subfamily)
MPMPGSDDVNAEPGIRDESRPSDRTLLRQFQRGEAGAATLLYMRYAARIASLAGNQRGQILASRFDPDDIVQSIFRTFFRRAAEGQYDVPEGEDLWKLFLVIALHKVRDACSFHRAARRDVRVTRSIDSSSCACAIRTSDDEVGLAELRMVLDELLGGLPATQRAIVELRIDGCQVDEIACKTGRSRRTVERGLQEFRAQLSAVLREGQ